MTELRQDPFTKDWVIIATERARRPHQLFHVAPRPPEEGPRADCPFCPGNEAMTPAALYEPRDNGTWTVRVFPNKYPALRVEDSPERSFDDGRFIRMGGLGMHEVVVESPHHYHSIDTLPEAQTCEIINALLARFHDLKRDSRIKTLILFKNSGSVAGATIEHPHWQLIGVPVVPPEIRRKYAVASLHFDEMGQNLYRSVIESELRSAERLVLESDHFVALQPYAARVPFETWIFPKAMQTSFGQLHGLAVNDFARVLKRVLAGVVRALGHANYNFVIHTAPFEDEHKSYFVWHLAILPRHSIPAGFELGTGIYINVTRPEETARYLRDVIR
jgi:UDPglucose--hexose-1-phosphate uridylyltransferase